VIVHDTDTGIAAGAPTANACDFRGAISNGGSCTPPANGCAVQASSIINALVYNTAVDGIAALAPCSVNVHAVTLFNTGSGPARSIDGTGNGTLDVSDVILSTAPAYGTLMVTGAGNLTLTSPTDGSWFLDAANGNFRLLAATPPIDHGVTLADVPSDLDGVARPQGAAYDVGAYERPLNGYPDGGVPILDGGTSDGGGGGAIGPGIGGGQPQPIPGCHCDVGGASGVSALELLLALALAVALLRRRRAR
jgi:MYXO-CTERM domain-containing protein